MIDEFSLESNKDNFEEMYKSTAHIGQKYELAESPEIAKMIDYALSSKVLIPLLDAAWKNENGELI